MKKIERAMAAAWDAEKPFYCDNTMVEVWSESSDLKIVQVSLFGNPIARKHIRSSGYHDKLWRTAGWNTTTTRSRLKALGVPVYNHKHQLMCGDKPASSGMDWNSF